MNKQETKLLVESWRNLLSGEEYTCGAEFLEACNFSGKVLNEAAIQKANTNKSKLLSALAALMISSSFGGALNKLHAKDISSRADAAFSEMNNEFANQELNEAEKEEKLLISMLDLLEEEAGMPSELRNRFEVKYERSSGETKAAIMVMVMKKVKSLAPKVGRRGQKDPLVKKYAAIDVEIEDDGKGKDGKGKDEKGQYIRRDGKKFYLTSTKVSQTTFRNQRLIDKMNSVKAKRR